MASSVQVRLPSYGYTYTFTGVLSIKHEYSLKLQTDSNSASGSDYINGARNQPGMLLSGLSVTEDEKNQFGWQGTLTFAQYKPTAAVKKTNDNSSAATHTGSSGQAQSVTGDALAQMLARAGVG